MQSSKHFKLRWIVFLAIFIFMAWGPFYRQVLGGRHPLFRHWIMFSGKGLGVVDAKFIQVFPDGRQVEIDRFEVLRISNSSKRFKKLWRIRGKTETLSIARRLCQQLGPNAELRVVSRWASREGWKQGFRGQKNLCAQTKHNSQRRGAR